MNKGKRKHSAKDGKARSSGRRGGASSRASKSPISSAAASPTQVNLQRVRSMGNPRVAVSVRIVPELRDKMEQERVRLKMANLSEFMEKAIRVYLDKIRTR